MSRLLLFILVLAASAFVLPQEPKYDMKVRQLVFLVAAGNAPELSQEEAAAKQKAHLEYLESLWKEGKALLVGPLRDAGRYRGIVLLDVEKKEEAEALIAKDPWIGAGQLKAEYKPWFVARNVPRRGPSFLDIEPLWFGLLKRPANAPNVTPEESKEIQAGHMANIQRMADSGDLVLAGPVGEDSELRGIFIFRTKEKARVQELASQDPAIQRGRLVLELFPWYTAKGTFPAQEPARASAGPAQGVQMPGGPSDAELSAMKKLAFLEGRWEGTGWNMTPDRKRVEVRGSELVEMKLHGRALLVQGLFHDKADSERVVHETLAVITFDERKNAYNFRTYLYNAPPADHTLKLVDGGLSWELGGEGRPPITFTMRLNEKGEWHEYGEVTVQGRQIRFMEMTLVKVNP